MIPKLQLADLPIRDKEEEILRILRTRQVLVLAGETGSGKTTQIPKLCLLAGLGETGRVAVTQPRRVAAIALARRVAEEMETTGSDVVGHKVRFDDRTGKGTKVVFATDGALLAELSSDPLLRRYSCIVVDEAHERSLNIDFLLGVLRQILSKRSDLRVVVSSATIDTERFSQAFRDAQGPAPVVVVEGRTYPVDVLYRDELVGEEERDESLSERAASACIEMLSLQNDGDVLCFLPGEREIRDTQRELEKSRDRAVQGIEIVPLFGRLSAGDQDKVFHPGSRRRVILSTNVAETSVTVPRIRMVVDAGLVRLSRYASRTRTKRLQVEPASQASAKQRAGRCGRLGPGICLRLFSREDFESREVQTAPEVQRSDLSEVILRMLELGLGDPEAFPFLDQPEPAALLDGWRLLQELGAVDEERKLTPAGKQMARLPLDPRSSCILLRSKEEKCLADVLVLVAGLAIPDPRERPEGKETQARQAQATWDDKQSDFFTLLNLWEACEKELSDPSGNRLRKFCQKHYLSYMRMRDWRESVRQLREMIAGIEGFKNALSSHGDYGQVHRSLLSGFLSNLCRVDEEATARLQRGMGKKKAPTLYRATRGRSLKTWPGSILAGNQVRWLVAAEIVETTQLWARTCAEISPEWIEAIAGDLLRAEYAEPRWDEGSQRVVATQRLYLWGLPVASGRLVAYSKIDPVVATDIFCREALVLGQLRTRHGFLEHNHGLRAQVEELEERLRRRTLFCGEDALFSWYRSRVPDGVGSAGDLDGLVKARGNDLSLRQELSDLVFDPELIPDEPSFPSRWKAGPLDLPLTHRFDPESELDGVTVSVKLEELELIPDAALEWFVPGHLPDRIEALLRNLPREVRQKLPPPAQLAREAAKALAPMAGRQSLRDALRSWGQTRQMSIPTSLLTTEDGMEAWMRFRIEVLDAQGNALASGRDLSALRQELSKRIVEATRERLARSSDAILRTDLFEWPADLVLPTKEEISSRAGGIPLTVFPGLATGDRGAVARRFPTAQEAWLSHRDGVRQILSHTMVTRDKTFAWLPRDVRLPQDLLLELARWTKARDFEDALLACGQDWCFEAHLSLPEVRNPAQFQAALDASAQRVRQLRAQAEPFVRELLAARKEFEEEAKKAPRLAVLADKIRERLWSVDFPRQACWSGMMHAPRWWKAAARRIKSANENPARDQARVQDFAPCVKAVEALSSGHVPPRIPGEVADPDWREKLGAANFLLEELRVQIWAQELGTAVPASLKRVKEQLSGLGIEVR